MTTTGEPYEYRTNFKNKPNSQGTLFQVQDKGLLNPQQRWPRGYTPERLNDVRGALAGTPISYPDRMEDEHEPGDYKEMMSYRPRTFSAIARSTIPTEHLKGITEIGGEPDEGTVGTYTYNERRPGVGRVDVDMTHPEAERTLIHEIGHHVDHLTGARKDLLPGVAQQHAQRELDADPKASRWHSEPNSTHVHMKKKEVDYGVGEAVADNYLQEHYRTPGRPGGGGRGEQVHVGAYEENFTRDELDKKYPGYTDVRPSQYAPKHPNLNMQQFGRQEEMFPREDVRR